MRNVCRLVLAILTATTLVTAAAPAFAQGRPDRPRHDGGGGRMSGEDRQRLREDLQRQQADPRRGGDPAGEERARRYAEWQRLSPEQRDRVRGDMREANRDFERRR